MLLLLPMVVLVGCELWSVAVVVVAGCGLWSLVRVVVFSGGGSDVDDCHGAACGLGGVLVVLAVVVVFVVCGGWW